MKLEDAQILVTGSTGFLGRIFLSFLKENGIEHVVYSHKSDRAPVSRYTCVIHFGGLTPHSPSGFGTVTSAQFHEANVNSTKKLLARVGENRLLRKFINIGSFAEYGFSAKPFYEGADEHPVGAYAKSKLAQSRLVERFA